MGGKLIRECRGLAQNCFIFEIVWLLVKRKYQKPRVFNKKRRKLTTRGKKLMKLGK